MSLAVVASSAVFSAESKKIYRRRSYTRPTAIKFKGKRLTFKKSVNDHPGGDIIKRITLIRRACESHTLDIYFVHRLPKSRKKESKNVTRDAVSWADDVIDSANMPYIRQRTPIFLRIAAAVLFAFDSGLILGILI